MERQLGISEARKQLGQIIDQAEYKGENCVIIRHGQPAAAVVPMAVYLRWKKERDDLVEVIRKMQTTNVDADPEQVMRQVLEAQQLVRQRSAG
jgi:prevent-host-death family protein